MSITNIQLEDLARKSNIPLNGIFMKDEMTFQRQNGNYIINLDDSHNEGTHWCALIVKDNICFYFNSFGVPCPEQVIKFCKKPKSHLYFNTRIIQHLDSNLCGFYCMGLLKYISCSNKPLLESANDYSNLFDNSEQELNGFLLKGYLNQFNIKLKKYLFRNK